LCKISINESLFYYPFFLTPNANANDINEDSLYSLLFSGKKIVGFILFLIVERKFYK